MFPTRRRVVRRPSLGQVAIEFLVALMAVGVVLFVPLDGAAPLAETLRRALGEFLEATLLALSLV